MDNIKYISFGVLAVLAVVFGALFLKGVTAPTYNYQAMSGPESTNNYQCYDGICTFYSVGNVRTATTTPCLVVSPSATSTLVSIGGYLSGTTTAYSVTVATSTANVYATTTPLAVFGAGANAGIEFGWQATSSFSGGSGIMKPSSLVVVSMTGGVGTFSPTGRCNATFRKL